MKAEKPIFACAKAQRQGGWVPSRVRNKSSEDAAGWAGETGSVGRGRELKGRDTIRLVGYEANVMSTILLPTFFKSFMVSIAHGL